VHAEASLPQLVNFLKDFYSLRLPHQVRELSMFPRGSSPRARLDVSFQVEVLVLPDAEARESLLPLPDSRILGIESIAALQGGPGGLALAPWLLGPTGPAATRKLAAQFCVDREYDRLAAKNIFVGLAPPSRKPAAASVKLDFIRLTSIVVGDKITEASLHNAQTNQRIRLRTEGEMNRLQIRGSGGQPIFQATVVAISQRKLLLRAGAGYGIVRVGQTLSQMERKTQLSQAELAEFALKVEVVNRRTDPPRGP
jgi:hypothetical protein